MELVTIEGSQYGHNTCRVQSLGGKALKIIVTL